MVKASHLSKKVLSFVVNGQILATFKNRGPVFYFICATAEQI